jgi:hypothetical protein
MRTLALGILALGLVSAWGCSSSSGSHDHDSGMMAMHCAKCNADMKSDMVMKCKCGADVKEGDLLVKCPKCSGEVKMSDCKGSCPKCGAAMSQDACKIKCPKCGGEADAKAMCCPHCMGGGEMKK